MEPIIAKASEYGLLGIMLAYLMFMHFRLENRVAERDKDQFQQREKMIEALVVLREAINGLKDHVLGQRH